MSAVALDADRLAQLRVFSDLELRQIASGVIDAIAEQLRRVEQALPARDLVTAAEAAHRGRNETLLVGARELCDAFTALEEAARGGQLGAADDVAATVRGLWPGTRAAIERIMDSFGEPVIVAIETESDIATARNTAREVASEIGFSSRELTLIATAISEVARNIAVHAPPGEISMQLVTRAARTGIRIQAVDHGPGIEDVELALKDGFSTTKSLGIGLPCARRLMDEFELVSDLDEGTKVTMTKWQT